MTSTIEFPSDVAGARDELVARLAGPTVLVCGIVNVTPDSFFDGGRCRARPCAHRPRRRLARHRR